ncbi:exodeoxyribonuclease VII small subunit [candidate division WOR-3 bacterium]|nr:exodeoxyribonuclease VII small subunit [candidate division WOR-3 bacterium]
MKELETIVKQLETGNQNLDDSLKLFERGVELARQCKLRLDEAELKVSKLVKDKEGLFRQEPLAEDE